MLQDCLQLMEREEYQAAIECLQLHTEGLEAARAAFNTGCCYYGLRDFSKAIAWYDKAIAMESGNYPTAFCNKGVCLLELGKYELAIQAYDAAIATSGGNYPTAFSNKGSCLVELDKYELAMQAYDMAIAISGGKFPEAYYNKGLCFARMGDNRSAMLAFDEAIASAGGTYPPASYDKGVCLVDLNQYELAILVFNEALASAGGVYPRASCNKGWCFIRLKDFELAMIALEKAIADSPGGHYPLAWINKAITHFELRNKQAAKKSAFTAIVQDSMLRLGFDFIRQYFTIQAAYTNRVKLLDIVFMRQLQKINFSNSKNLIQALNNFEDETTTSLFISLLLHSSDILGTGMDYAERLRQAYLIAAVNKEPAWVFYIIDYLLDVQDEYTLDALDYYFYLTAAQEVAAPLSELERIATDAGYHNITFTAIDEYLYEISTPLSIDRLDSYLKNETEKLLYHQHWLTKQPYTVNITRNELELQYLSAVGGISPSDDFNSTTPAFIILQDCLRKQSVSVDEVGYSLENLLRSAKHAEVLQAILLLSEAEASHKLTAKDTSLLKAFLLLKYEKVQEHNRQEAHKGNVDVLTTSIGSTAVGQVIGLFVPGIFLYSLAISLISSVTVQLLRNPIKHFPDFSWNNFLDLLKENKGLKNELGEMSIE